MPQLYVCDYYFYFFLNRQGDDYSISCPVCRDDLVLPEKGPIDLPNAFHINSLLELREKLTTTKQEATSLMACPKHNDPLRVYCETCHEVICRDCTIAKEHSTHDFHLISECYPKHRQQIQDGLDQLEHKVSSMDTALAHLAASEEEILEQGQQIKDELNAHAEHVIDQVERSRIQLSQQVDAIVQQKTRLLAAQKQEAEKVRNKLKSCHEMIGIKLDEWNEYHVLAKKSTLIDEMGIISAPVNPEVFQPLEKADFNFTKNKVEIGSIYSTTFGKATLETSPCVLNQQSVVYVCIQSQDGTPLSLPPSLVSSSLNSPGVKHAVKCDITQVDNGKYSIKFTPSTRADQLAVQIGGIDITDSPFVIPVPETIKGKVAKAFKTLRNFL